MVNQLLRMGRGNAAAVQQAKARSERRRMCEQLDAWVDAPSASGSGSGGGGGDGSLRNENGTVEGHARADVAAVASPNVGGGSLADVRAMSWADGADADPPPTGATPRRDASGNVAGTPGSIGRIPVGTVGRPLAGAPTSTPASASRLGAAPAAAATSAAAERADFAAANPPAFECDWGDADDGFDLAAAAAATETAARARRSAVAGSVADALGADSPPRRARRRRRRQRAGRKRRNATPGSRRKVRWRWTRGASSPRRDATTAPSNSSLGRAATILGAASSTARQRGPRRARFRRFARLATPRGRPATNPEDPTAPVDVRCDGDTLVVMHPGTMVNSTAVGSSMQCLRRTVLQTVVPDGADGDFAQAAMLGTLARAQRGVALRRGVRHRAGCQGFFKHAAELAESSSERLFGAGVTEREAIDRLRYVGPGVHKWTRRLVKPSAAGRRRRAPRINPRGWSATCWTAPGGDRAGKVTLTKMVDAEETVWTPKLGLRGVVDAVAVGKLDEPAPAPGGRAVVTSGWSRWNSRRDTGDRRWNTARSSRCTR